MVTRVALPQINPLADNPEDTIFTTPSGQKFTFAEMVVMLEQNGASLDLLSGALGMTKDDIRKWNQQVKAVLAARDDQKGREIKAARDQMDKIRAKLGYATGKLTSVTPETTNFVTGSTAAAATSPVRALDKTAKAMEGTGSDGAGLAHPVVPKLLQQIYDILSSLEKKFTDMFKLQKKKIEDDTENEIEHERKGDPEPSWLAKAMGRGKEGGEDESKLIAALHHGFGLLFATMFNPEEIAANIGELTAALGLKDILKVVMKPAFLAGIGGIAMAINDGITEYVNAKDWKTSDIAAALGGFLGGQGQGGTVWDALANGGKYALIGMGIGMVGGLPGIIVGGIVGAAVGGILGWIGPEKIAKFINTATDKINEWSSKLIGTNLYIDTDQVNQKLDISKHNIEILNAHIAKVTQEILDNQADIDKAVSQGNTQLANDLKGYGDSLQKQIDLDEAERKANFQRISDSQEVLRIAQQRQGWNITQGYEKIAGSVQDEIKDNTAASERVLAELRKTGAWWSSDQSPFLTYGDKIRLWFIRLGDTIWGSVGAGLTNAYKIIIAKPASWVSEKLSEMMQSTQNFFGGIVKGVGDAIASYTVDFGWIKSGLDNIVGAMTGWFNGMIDNIKKNIAAALGWASPTATKDAVGFQDTDKGGWQKILNMSRAPINIAPDPMRIHKDGPTIDMWLANEKKKNGLNQSNAVQTEILKQSDPRASAIDNLRSQLVQMQNNSNNRVTNNNVSNSTTVLGGGINARDNSFLGGGGGF